tara:strand:- start:483 stop:650 length:168 start_codon:yes stop_codon:yes gene_type:complete
MPFVRGQGSIVQKTAQASFMSKLFTPKPKKQSDVNEVAQTPKAPQQPTVASKTFF